MVVNMGVYQDKFDYVEKLKMKVFKELSKPGPKKTRIIISDADTGEIHSDTHNRILISASQLTACYHWGVDPVVHIPTYNEEWGLDGTLDSNVQPENDIIVCQFIMGQGGCGTVPTDTYVVRNTERLEPNDCLPFRYVEPENDLNSDLRAKSYFGRYVDNDNMVRYMTKSFSTSPMLHMQYLDGTQITSDFYKIDSDQAVECFIEIKLDVTRNDFRDYFEKVIGWDGAFINSLSLLFGWYHIGEDGYPYYQQLTGYSKLNFSTEWLVDLSKALTFTYQIFY